MKLCVHYKEYSFMGFLEVVQNLRKIKSLFRLIKKQIVEFNPDKVVFIDYGGFNLKIAKFCKEHGLQTHFFILPKVWAWNEKRVLKIKKNVDYGYCIFPFEEDYFRNHGVNAFYVGNPVASQVERYQNEHQAPKVIPNQVALLPGSRPQEIEKMLPVFLAFAQTASNLTFVIAAHSEELYKAYDLPNNVRLEVGKTFAIVRESQIALVTSGTANLETALLGTPQVVCYRANPVSFFIGKRLVKIQYISPVNLIMDKLVIKELIQNDLNAVTLAKEAERLLQDSVSSNIKEDYKKLGVLLGDKNAAQQTAQLIYDAK